MQPIHCELELDKLKVREKRLCPELNTHIPPDITPNTRILAGLGIKFLSDFFAFHYLFRGLTKDQLVAARAMADIQVPDEELRDRVDIPPPVSFLSQSLNIAPDRRMPATGSRAAVCIQRRRPPTSFLFSPSPVSPVFHSSLCFLTYLPQHASSTISTSKYTQSDLRISAQ